MAVAALSDRDWVDAHLVKDRRDIHRDDPEFGHGFIADELERKGQRVSENRVHRLCREHRIWSTTAKRMRVQRKAGPPVHDDLVDRGSPPSARINVGSATSLNTRRWKGSCICARSRICGRNRIVGYSVADRMTAALAVAATRNAGLRRDAAGVTVHTDRGLQFRSRALVATLNELDIVGR